MMKAITHLQVLAAVFLTIATAVSLPNADGNIVWVLRNFVELNKATCFGLISNEHCVWWNDRLRRVTFTPEREAAKVARRSPTGEDGPVPL